MLGSKTEKQVLEMFPKNTILAAYRGSIAHGMYVPNTDPNSIDDIDLFGIFMAPMDVYLGLTTHNKYCPSLYDKYRETVESFYDEYDMVSYEFKKMMRMLIASNPNVLSLLNLKQEHYIKMTKAGQQVVDNKHLFYSLYAYRSFAKYAENQLKKMTQLSFKGYMGTKRRELVKQFGYDTKNAAHCIRLLRTCVEFLETGELNVYRSEDAEELLEIKLGKHTLESVKLEASYLFEKAKKAKALSSLPETPDYAGIERLTKRIMYDYIKDNQDVYVDVVDVTTLQETYESC